MDAHDLELVTLQDELTCLTRNSLDQLFNLWNKMGIKGDLRASRKRDVLSHLKAIFVQMVKEEEVNFEKLTTSIRRYEEERRNLMLDLHMTDDNNNYGGTNEDESLVAAESRMKKMVKKLLQEKVAQMKVFEEIKEAEEALCEATGSLPCGISLDGCLPTDAQRQAIEDHVRQLEAIRDAREIEFEAIRSRIRDFHERLETEPGSSHERHIICSDIGSIKLPQDTIDSAKEILQSLEAEVQANIVKAAEMIEDIRKISQLLKISHDTSLSPSKCCSYGMIRKLQQHLDGLKEEKKKHIMVFIKSAQRDLEQLWTRCYVGEESKVSFLSNLGDKAEGETLDDVLESYEASIKTWTQYYDQNERIFNKLHEWFSLWEASVQLEESMKDPNRLGDFRRLREEEKTRNRVNKKLPIITRDLEEMTKKYLVEHGADFIINGMTFSELQQQQRRQSAPNTKGSKKAVVVKTFGGNAFRWQPTHNSTAASEEFTMLRKMSHTR